MDGIKLSLDFEKEKLWNNNESKMEMKLSSYGDDIWLYIDFKNDQGCYKSVAFHDMKPEHLCYMAETLSGFAEDYKKKNNIINKTLEAIKKLQ